MPNRWLEEAACSMDLLHMENNISNLNVIKMVKFGQIWSNSYEFQIWQVTFLEPFLGLSVTRSQKLQMLLDA